MRFYVDLERNPKKVKKIIDSILKKDNFLKKFIYWLKRNFKIYDIDYALRLIFAFFLMSEARLSKEIVHKIYRQLRNLFKSNNSYLEFIISNGDKFNKSNDEQLSSIYIIFESLLMVCDIHVRCQAARALGKIGTYHHIPLLKPLFRDKCWDVRRAAAQALGMIGTSKHSPLLVSLLRDEYEFVRIAAAEAVGKIGTAKDIPLLKPLLKDEDEAVRIAASEALGKVCTSDHIPLLESLLRDKNKYINLNAAQALGEIITEKDIPLLKPMFRDEDEDVRWAAAKVLGKVGTSAHINLLEPLIRDKVHWVRSSAAKALGEIGTAKDIHLLKSLLRDKELTVHVYAVQALGNIVTGKDIHLLEPLFKDENVWVRWGAVKVFRKIATVKDFPLMIPLLKDKDIIVRREVARVFETIGTPKHIPLLESLLRDENKFVRLSAAEALGKIGTSDPIPLIKHLLKDKNELVRINTAKAFGKIGTSDSISLLEPLLRDENDDVRKAASEALGKIGTDKGIPLLEPLLRDKNEDVRKSASKALGKIVTDKDIPLLESMLRDKDWILRYAAGKALVKIVTWKDIPLLKSLLNINFDYKGIFTEALGKVGTTKDIPLLEHMHILKPYVPTSAQAIEQIYRRSTPQLDIDTLSTKKIVKKRKKDVFPISSSIPYLHILHISDIHYAFEKDSTITQIFHEFLQDIKKWRDQQNNEKIHSICLTGDIAFSGQKSQYDSIYEKIDAILEAAGCSKENLFIIPGNHDVQEYDKISFRGKAALEEVWQNKKNIDSLMLSNFDHYREFHEKFTHYYRFLETSGYHGSLTEKYNGSSKPWYSRKLKDLPVRIMGLNSALFCLKEYCAHGQIHMGATQFHEAYMKDKKLGKSNDELLILLTHHPIEWLEENEKNELKTLIDRYSVIHLHGHVHRLDIKEVRSFSGSTYILVGTGSIYGEKGTNDINTYHIMTLDFAKKKVRIWGRRWVPEIGKWTVYADNNRNTFSFPGKHE